MGERTPPTTIMCHNNLPIVYFYFFNFLKRNCESQKISRKYLIPSVTLRYVLSYEVFKVVK